MGKTYKDSRNADKLRERDRVKRNRYLEQRRVYALELLERNPKIKHAYNEYKYADTY